jgi:hypothetical protein
VCFPRCHLEVGVKGEGGTIRKRDGGILGFEVDGGIHTCEPGHAEDEIKVTEVGHSGSARSLETLNVDVDVPCNVTGVLSGPVGHADVHIRGFDGGDLVAVREAFVEEVLLGSCVEKSNGRSAVDVHGVRDEDVGKVRKFDSVDVVRKWNGDGGRRGNRRDRRTRVELVYRGEDGEWRIPVIGPKGVNVFPRKMGPPLCVGGIGDDESHLKEGGRIGTAEFVERTERFSEARAMSHNKEVGELFALCLHEIKETWDCS